MKIRSKLFVLLVSLILTSFLAASFVSINVLSADMIRETKAHLEDDLTNSMDRISTDSYNRISDIRFLGDSMNVFSSQSGADLIMKLEILKKFGSHNDYSSISIYNKTGIKIADVKGIGIGENVSNETFFKKAIQGDIYRGSTPSSYLKSSKEKEIVLAGPLYDKSGKINEILLLSYPLNTKLVEHISTDSQSNLRINLLSDDGKIIYSNYDKSRSLSNANAGNTLETLPIYRLIKNSKNIVESAIFNDTGSSSGNAIFVAAKESSNNSSQSPDSIQNKWLLVASLDTQEAFNEVLSLRNMFIFITVIVLAVSIIALYIVADRTISIPITKLKNAAIIMGKGNLDTVITPPSTIDEIGELSSQFRKMRARIKARTEELMRKDKELENTNEQLEEKESILEKANEQLKNQEKMQKEFINVAAHELRTPIQPILGLSELLQSKEENEEKHKLLGAITRNAKRLHRLTEDILDISKIESQSLKLHKEQFNVNDLISNIVQDYRNQIEKDDITLLYKSKEDTNFLVEADRYRITQVISNLLDNAIKFTKEGTISVTLEKKKEVNQQEVLVSVKDSGTGIHRDILPRLFSKFATKAEKGTGLGLFISRSIVEAHGGRIWGENNVDGKGARFSFTLPLLEQYK
jgi:signal transduction histidine kinase